MNNVRPLNDIAVLECAAETGYCGKLLAMQGAQVKLVEPPGGFAARRSSPHFPATGESVEYGYFHAGKQSMVCDLERDEDLRSFRNILKSTDVVIDTRPIRFWESKDLAPEVIEKLYPHLIWCSITPFGQFGPHAARKADDLVLMAAGGMLQLAGTDKGPFCSPGRIATKGAAAFSAVAILLALLSRDFDGLGQYIDVSMQEVVTLGTETAAQSYDILGTVKSWTRSSQRQAGIGYYPCKDGYVMLYASDTGVGRGWSALVEWMIDCGCAAATELRSSEWRSNSFKMSVENASRFYEIFTAFSKNFRKQELFIQGQNRRIAISPVNDGKSVFEDPYLRSSFREIGDPLQPLIVPGPPAVMSETPFEVVDGAPALGEHISLHPFNGA